MVYQMQYQTTKPHVRHIEDDANMAMSIFDDLGILDDNRLPGWSFIHYGASEIVPSAHTSAEKRNSKLRKVKSN